MTMLPFDETQLVSRLAKMDNNLRAAFAAACSTRLMSTFDRYALDFAPKHLGTFKQAWEQVWSAVIEGTWQRETLEATLSNVMGIIPGEGNGWTPLHAYAEDAASALAYSLRALISNDPQEAAWAARTSYEAVDFAAQQTEIGFLPGDKDSEFKLLSNPLIQRELGRQEQDIADLERFPPSCEILLKIKQRALSQPALNVSPEEPTKEPKAGS
jgi:hypothetical protein